MCVSEPACLPVAPAVVELCIHDDNEVSADSQAPAQAARHDEQLDGARGEQLLHHLALQLRQALVEVGHTVGERLDKGLGERREGGEEGGGEGREGEGEGGGEEREEGRKGGRRGMVGESRREVREGKNWECMNCTVSLPYP